MRDTIGLALSGGGSRAIAFHLGCLRRLRALGLLKKISVISSVSGGSILAAMYAYSDEDFDKFDARVRRLLRGGLKWAALKTFFTDVEGPKAALTFIELISTTILLSVFRRVLTGAPEAISNRPMITKSISWLRRRLRRQASRTTVFERTLERELFGKRLITEKTRNSISIVINACELRTGSAFRFSNSESGSWRYGKIKENHVAIAKAVTASAAYPLILPALDETFRFVTKTGEVREAHVSLTDGGVYDNLGVTVLWPDRDPDFSFNISKVERIICCSAGQGLRFEKPGQFFKQRMQQVYETTFARAQNASISRLHDLVATKRINGLLLAMLGQRDDRLPTSRPEMVPRERVAGYPTNFDSMSDDDAKALINRGEQLMDIVAQHYWSDLIEKNK